MSKELKELKGILMEHRGKKNAITSKKIAHKLGIDEDDTHPKTRKLVLECMKEYQLPVGATNRGYFIITSEEELDEYVDNLNKRIRGDEKRRDAAIKFFWKQNDNTK